MSLLNPPKEDAAIVLTIYQREGMNLREFHELTAAVEKKLRKELRPEFLTPETFPAHLHFLPILQCHQLYAKCAKAREAARWGAWQMTAPYTHYPET